MCFKLHGKEICTESCKRRRFHKQLSNNKKQKWWTFYYHTRENLQRFYQNRIHQRNIPQSMPIIGFMNNEQPASIPPPPFPNPNKNNVMIPLQGMPGQQRC